MEEVSETEGRAFAKDIGAIFKCTSAKNSIGIEELFKSIGNKFIDPNMTDSLNTNANNLVPAELRERRETVRITEKPQKNSRGRCCSKN